MRGAAVQLGADNYDTLGGRVEALEEKLKNGVPVQMVPRSSRAAGRRCAASAE